MGKLLGNFAEVRNTVRVFLALRKVSMDAIRQALHEAEDDLAALKTIKKLSPDYTTREGLTIDEQIAAKAQRIRELYADLQGTV